MRVPTVQEILTAGFVDFRVKVSGVIQMHHFVVKREKTPFGDVPFLVLGASVPQGELSRAADELQLPIRTPSITAFPKGKMAKDFAGL